MNKPTLLKIACILFVFCAATAIAAQAQILTTLHSFCSQPNCADGRLPSAALVQAGDGNFYGTTYWGGANGFYGTVFKITPGGTLTTLHSFDGEDGAYPYAGLVQATDGNFYGTTSQGGNSNSSCAYELGTCGTVFKITASGTLTTLYSFCTQSNCSDGANPYAGLVQASDGNFYGTTWGGAASGNCSEGCGTVFKITSSGTLTMLHSFIGSDGSNPTAELVQASDGNFYGTTYFGGAYANGTVFKITPGGVVTTLYSFCAQPGCADGENPEAGLVQASDGNFYGTTLNGGISDSSCFIIGNGTCGTVFKITPSGTLTTLYRFCSQTNCADGAFPYAGLIQATDGDLYGTASGSLDHDGTIFKITPSGTLTTLYSFGGYSDGAIPYAGLVQASDRNLYGTTEFGGAYNGGIVFRLVIPRACAIGCPSVK